MKRLIIVGAGGLGREILSWMLDSKQIENYATVKFLDENQFIPIVLNDSYEIIGTPTTYIPQVEDEFICAISKPVVKLKTCRYLQAQGAKFITVKHPTAIVSSNSILGPGCVLYPHTFVSNDTTIGSFVLMNFNSAIGHNAVVSDGCSLNAFCEVTGNVMLGEGVFMGSHASVIPGIEVGSYAIIGAGSVVIRKVPPNKTMMGVPAKCIC